MSELEPKPDENALAFVERADATGVSDEAINSTLKSHFGMIEDGEIKSLKLKSSVYWDNFYLERVKGIFERGGSNYAAIRFIHRKNGHCGQRTLTEKEINELVDSVGPWQR
ncbi:MAG: hypothetical protein AAF423_07295 [Pseudomonadota bacterium]